MRFVSLLGIVVLVAIQPRPGTFREMLSSFEPDVVALNYARVLVALDLLPIGGNFLCRQNRVVHIEPRHGVLTEKQRRDQTAISSGQLITNGKVAFTDVLLQCTHSANHLTDQQIAELPVVRIYVLRLSAPVDDLGDECLTFVVIHRLDGESV